MSFAGKYLKPYQGLKLAAKYSPQRQTRRKIPKTLSGIETQILGFHFCSEYVGRKIPKTLSGIETQIKGATSDFLLQSRKIPKTLSGIETNGGDLGGRRTKAGKYLKPYQGLKPF